MVVPWVSRGWVVPWLSRGCPAVEFVLFLFLYLYFLYLYYFYFLLEVGGGVSHL